MEAVRRERAKGRRIVATNRELWIEGIKWRWEKKGQEWEKEAGEEGKVEGSKR